MTPRDRAFYLLPWAIAAVLIAGVVHIVSVLIMPYVAPNDAYHRLLEATQSQEDQKGVVVLPPTLPSAAALPLEDPSMAEGVCLFDLSKGLLHVTASVGDEDFIGLSFHAATGRIFHALTDRGANKGKIDIVVGDARQIEDLSESDDDEAPAEETRVTAPGPRGFVLIRALAKRPSDMERALAAVRAVACDMRPETE